MTYAVAFLLVYVYGAGVMLPILYTALSLTHTMAPWKRVAVSLGASLGWPVIAVGWLVADE